MACGLALACGLGLWLWWLLWLLCGAAAIEDDEDGGAEELAETWRCGREEDGIADMDDRVEWRLVRLFM